MSQLEAPEIRIGSSQNELNLLSSSCACRTRTPKPLHAKKASKDLPSLPCGECGPRFFVLVYSILMYSML